METKKYLEPKVKIVTVRVVRILCTSDKESVQMNNYLNEDALDW